MTGSTNWTPTGLCAQSNNVVIFESEPLAALFLDYWNRLRDDVKQAPDLRTFGATLPAEIGLGPGQGAISMRFSPNTVRKTKPKSNPPAPPDMAEVFAAIEAAKLGVLFLVFSAGAPSILQQLREVETARALRGEPFFVRGAISDAKTAREFADTRVFNDSARKRGNRIVTGIGGVRDPFAFWQRELAKLGHAVIHDKVLVVDPFTPDSIVVTGSHNLGFKASYSNDENLCVIRGNAGIAHAFTAHVLDIVNHYNWRFKLQREGPIGRSRTSRTTIAGRTSTSAATASSPVATCSSSRAGSPSDRVGANFARAGLEPAWTRSTRSPPICGSGCSPPPATMTATCPGASARSWTARPACCPRTGEPTSWRGSRSGPSASGRSSRCWPTRRWTRSWSPAPRRCGSSAAGGSSAPACASSARPTCATRSSGSSRRSGAAPTRPSRSATRACPTARASTSCCRRWRWTAPR